jgi:cytochrome c-type protein NapC
MSSSAATPDAWGDKGGVSPNCHWLKAFLPYLPVVPSATLDTMSETDTGSEAGSPSLSWMDKLARNTKILATISAIVFFFLAVVVLPAAAWLVGDASFTATSDDGFCADCHTMQPFAKANADNIHGGVNHMGIKATCSTCHLPHDSSWSYLTEKLRTGIHDIWVQTFTDTSKIDWKAKTEHREEFVYDSGCLSCHVELEAATAGKRQHDNYFAGVTDSKCVTCHSGVGHSNLNKYLLEHKYRQ